MRLSRYLGRQSRLFLTLFGLALVVFLGTLDYLTGPELSFSIFYLIPISMAAWHVGRRVGIAMSIAGAASWLLADLLTGPRYSYPTIPYWNTGVRLGFFLIATYTLSALRASRERQEELSYFVVHDLRSPLSNVMTGLQILHEMVGQTGNATQANLVDACIVSGNRILTLVNSLLDLGRMERGQMPLHLSEVGVGDLVEPSLQQVSLWARRNHVDLTARLDPSVRAVYADSELTTRVLVNLLSNAIKFSHPESAVSISAVPFGTGMVAFSVADHGQGIPKRWADRMFNKFVQVEADRRGEVVGSGLGLAFCRLAVQLQGGRIWLQSEAGEGTTVTFTLPGSTAGLAAVS